MVPVDGAKTASACCARVRKIKGRRSPNAYALGSQWFRPRCARTGFLNKYREHLPFRFLFAYDLRVDKQRENGALLIAASIIAAIRLRGEPVKPSPKLACVVSDSVELARMVLARILNR